MNRISWSYWASIASILAVSCLVWACGEDGTDEETPPKLIILTDAGDPEPTDTGPVDPSECQLDCDDGNACTTGRVSLEGPTCESAICEYETQTECVDGDGCCPSRCANADDSDCDAVCGDAFTGGAETCDGDCPTDPSQCPTRGACQLPSLIGRPEQCNVECSYRRQTECIDDDGCCAQGCTLVEDSDCRQGDGLPYMENIDVGIIHDTAVTVDGQGSIHAVYIRQYGQHWGLVYITNEEGTWRTEELVELVRQPYNARIGGIAVDDYGDVHVVFSKFHYSDFAVFHLDEWSGPDWRSTKLSDPGRVTSNSFVLGRNDRAAIAYLHEDKGYYAEVQRGDVRYSRGTFQGAHGIDDTSLAMVNGDAPVIHLAWNGSLQQVFINAQNQWEIGVVADGGPSSEGFDVYFGHTALGYDSQDRAYAGYSLTRSDTATPLHRIRVDKWNGSAWQNGLVYGTYRDLQTPPFSRLDLEVDSNDEAHISWEEKLDSGEVRAGYATNQRGDWNADYFTGPIVEHTQSLAVGPQDRPVMLYGTSTEDGGFLTLLRLRPEATCTPDCTDRACGPDGCGGTCGDCLAPEGCRGNQCPCQPDCTGRQCGGDGCGGTCGSCASNESCDQNGQCICVPDCSGQVCGDDGCGGSCGTCTTGESCTPQGQCCVPDCSGKVCGGDGCGGSCGTCGSGQACNAQGQCEEYTGPCDPVSQSMCGSGQKCTFDGSDFICVADGSTGVGMSCYEGICEAGSICAGSGSSTLCRQFCYSDSDCNPGGECVLSLTGANVDLCTNYCDPLNSATCPSGQGCYVANFPGSSEVTDCRQYGYAFEGDSCNQLEDCWTGLSCVGGQCRKICAAFGGSCSTGACQPVSGWSVYGVCPL